MTTIVVDLIHPIRQEAVQSWTFDESQTSIRIGRSRRNDITLLSGVVSREHAMLHFNGRTWTLRSLGSNGCFLNDRLVNNPVVRDGDIFRIARTGPRLRISIQATAPTNGSPKPQAKRPPAIVTAPPRSRLSQEEITTARETWMASPETNRAAIQRSHALAHKKANT